MSRFSVQKVSAIRSVNSGLDARFSLRKLRSVRPGAHAIQGNRHFNFRSMRTPVFGRKKNPVKPGR